MVNPIYLFIIALGTAFFLPLLKNKGLILAKFLFLLVLFFFTGSSIHWLLKFLTGSEEVLVYTAGFKPPLSINLKLGLQEAFILCCVNSVALGSALLMLPALSKKSPYAFITFLLAVMGINGLILTRDLFNIFVFIEITSISTYSLFTLNPAWPNPFSSETRIEFELFKTAMVKLRQLR